MSPSSWTISYFVNFSVAENCRILGREESSEGGAVVYFSTMLERTRDTSSVLL